MLKVTSHPNILLITTDQQRWDALGINNTSTPLRTTNCDHLAASGVNFSRAYSTCPVCIPARRSLLTGLHPLTHGLRRFQDGVEWEPPFTLPGILSREGWHTSLIGKLHLYPQRKRYGFNQMIRTESPNDRWDTELQWVNDWGDWLKERGVPMPNNLGIGSNSRLARPWDMEERYHHTSWLADQAVDFLVKYRDPSAPFFLHLSFCAPHPPLTPPQAYWDRYAGKNDYAPIISEWTPQFKEIPRGISGDSPRGPFSLEEIQNAATGYYGLIHHIDDRIQFVITRMFEYGSPRAKEPTLIIFTSDHGELLGDHHLWRKSLPYEGSAHIPFFIAWRNMDLDLKKGVSDALVCLEDIVPTVLDCCGCSIPRELKHQREGQSLLPILRGERSPVRDQLFGECGNRHFLIIGRYKYIWFGDTNEEQLFDLGNDPMEKRDISSERPRLTVFRQALANHLKDRDDCRFNPDTCKPCENSPPRALWPDRI